MRVPGMRMIHFSHSANSIHNCVVNNMISFTVMNGWSPSRRSVSAIIVSDGGGGKYSIRVELKVLE
jgi:hypothetical protein